jgi:hypothetical protein
MTTRSTSLRSSIFSLTAFSIAMGFLEAVVVVYLRQLYYPGGFGFPLKPMTSEAFSIECLREISTIAVLFFVGIASGRSFPERSAYFLYGFGIWDITYYVWLKVLLNWPSSLLTWDILFLIPVVWVGPVLAPLICSVTMIMIAGVILYFHGKGCPVRIEFRECMAVSAGTLAIFLAFVWDYSKIIIQGGFISELLSLGEDPRFQGIVSHYVPGRYNWQLFLIGEGLVLWFLMHFCNRLRSKRGTPQ